MLLTWKVAPFNEAMSTRADGMHLPAEGYFLLLFLFMKRVENRRFVQISVFCYVCLFRQLVSFELVFGVFSRNFVLPFCSSFVQVVKFLLLGFIFASDESVLTAIERCICWSVLNCILGFDWSCRDREFPFREYLPKVVYVWCVMEVFCSSKQKFRMFFRLEYSIEITICTARLCVESAV